MKCETISFGSLFIVPESVYNSDRDFTIKNMLEVLKNTLSNATLCDKVLLSYFNLPHTSMIME